MAVRGKIGKRLRFEVFKRDAFACQYCGRTPPKAVLHVDHIIPLKSGGGNEIDNLVTSCDACNLGKGAVSLTSIPESLAEKAERVEEAEMQIRGYAEVMRAKKEREEREVWEVAAIFCDAFRIDTAKDGMYRDWLLSIKRFIGLLSVELCQDAMEIATARVYDNQGACFRYFCGICWKSVRENNQDG